MSTEKHETTSELNQIDKKKKLDYTNSNNFRSKFNPPKGNNIDTFSTVLPT